MVSFAGSEGESQTRLAHQTLPGATARGGTTAELANEINQLVNEPPSSPLSARILNAIAGEGAFQDALLQEASRLGGGADTTAIRAGAPEALNQARANEISQLIASRKADLTSGIASRGSQINALLSALQRSFPETIAGQVTSSETDPLVNPNDIFGGGDDNTGGSLTEFLNPIVPGLPVDFSGLF